MRQHASGETYSSGLGGFVCCHVGGEQYAMRGAHVTNVARADGIVPEPDGRARVGTLGEGASAIPVFGLGALFGLRGAASAEGYVVVTHGSSGPIGLLVDRIVRASGDAASDVCPLPRWIGRTAASWFDGLLRLEGSACLVLAPGGLDPRAPAATPRTVRSQARRPAGPAAHGGMVVTFSSPALPDGGTRRYAINGHRVAALVQELPSVPLPGRGPHIRNVAWWRKAAVPVLEFPGARAPRASRGAERYLVARCGTGADAAFVAFGVDPDVMLHQASIEDAQISGPNGLPFLRGVFNVSGEGVGLLDLDALTAGLVEPSRPAEVRVAALI